jgi:hypothetical protein
VERRLATALFADLVDSTGPGEQDPERTRALLERFYDAMAAEIVAAGGTVRSSRETPSWLSSAHLPRRKTTSSAPCTADRGPAGFARTPN